MRLTFRSAHGSIQTAVTYDDLPPLVVLSGTNGAGKTHLLEALSNGSTTIDDMQPGQLVARGDKSKLLPGSPVKYIPFNGLVPSAPDATAALVEKEWDRIVNAIGAERAKSTTPMFATMPTPELPIGADAAARLRAEGVLSERSLSEIEERSGKKLNELCLSDLALYCPPLVPGNDPFKSSISAIFLSYYERRKEHRLKRYNLEQGLSNDQNFWTEEEIVRNFGRPPWDVLNDALRTIGLPYQLASPEGYEPARKFTAAMHDVERNLEGNQSGVLRAERACPPRSARGGLERVGWMRRLGLSSWRRRTQR